MSNKKEEEMEVSEDGMLGQFIRDMVDEKGEKGVLSFPEAGVVIVVQTPAPGEIEQPETNDR
jgi:hypothetical protein